MAASHGTGTKLLGLLILLNRLALGSIFLLAGVRKLFPAASIRDVGMNLYKFASHVAGEAPLPGFLGQAYGTALPVVEIVAGLLLVLGLWSRPAASLIALMLFSFMIALGIEWWPAKGPAFDKNVILFTLSLLLVALGPGRYALDAVLVRRRRARSR